MTTEAIGRTLFASGAPDRLRSGVGQAETSCCHSPLAATHDVSGPILSRGTSMSDHDADGQRCPSKNPFDTVPGPSPVPALGKLLRLCHMLALEGKQLAAVMAEGNGSELSHDYLIPIRHLASEAFRSMPQGRDARTSRPSSQIRGCSGAQVAVPRASRGGPRKPGWHPGDWGGSRNNSCGTLRSPEAPPPGCLAFQV